MRTLLGDHGALPPRLAAELLRQLLSALERVHAAGIVHRDIKPANLLLGVTGRGRPHLYLTDFGIAGEIDGPRLTRSSAVVGTAGYLSPEQLHGAEPEVTQDLYAVGALAREMLTGMRPRDTPGPVSTTPPPGVPVALWELTRGLLDHDPDRRPQNAAAVRLRLELPELAWQQDAIGDVDIVDQHAASPHALPAAGSAQAAAGVEMPTEPTRCRSAAVQAAPRPERGPGLSRGLVGPAVVGVGLLVAALLTWSPWSEPHRSPHTPGTGATASVAQSSSPSPRSTPPPATSSSATPPSASVTRTAIPPIRPSGSVAVTRVVGRIGQSCAGSEVGRQGRLPDQRVVVCRALASGRLAWVTP